MERVNTARETYYWKNFHESDNAYCESIKEEDEDDKRKFCETYHTSRPCTINVKLMLRI